MIADGLAYASSWGGWQQQKKDHPAGASSSSSAGARRGATGDSFLAGDQGGTAVAQAPLEWEYGRPILETEMRRVETLGSNALVFVCGPPSLVDECRLLAHEKGLSFRAEGSLL